MSKRSVVRRHVLRNALGPILTITGLLVAGLLVASAVVETAFSLNGMGSLLVQSVDKQDFADRAGDRAARGVRVRRRQHDRRHRLPVHRPARDGRKCRPMSILVGVEPGPAGCRGCGRSAAAGCSSLSCAVLVGFVAAGDLRATAGAVPAGRHRPAQLPRAAERGALAGHQPGRSGHLVAAHLRIADEPGRSAVDRRAVDDPRHRRSGLLAGWRGGWVDAALSRVFDIMFAFPGLLLAILAVALFGKGLRHRSSRCRSRTRRSWLDWSAAW